jgi:hypothetical protein
MVLEWLITYNLQVREMVAVLDLDVLFYPCPKDGPNFRPKAIQLGGKKQFPYMVCRAVRLLLVNCRAILYVLIV